MDFPQGSHIHKDVPSDDSGLESNGKKLEEYLKRTNWKYLGRAYAYGWAVLLISVFTLIVVIRLALIIF